MTDRFAALDARHKVHEQDLLPELQLLAEAVGSQVTLLTVSVCLSLCHPVSRAS